MLDSFNESATSSLRDFQCILGLAVFVTPTTAAFRFGACETALCRACIEQQF